MYEDAHIPQTLEGDMDNIRYYFGDASDLDGLTREEVIDVTDGHYQHCGDRYEEMITEIYGEVTLGNFTWEAGRVLREMDPVAFRCGVADETHEIDIDDYPTGDDDDEEL